MTARGEDEGKSKLPATYEVGYGKPPIEHQFQKGKSGNPAGRPRGTRKKSGVDTGYGMKATEEMLKLEAYRPVTIREGDKLIELPAIQAVFRAMGVSALKGNRLAQRELANLTTRVENEDHRNRFELFDKAIDFKLDWEREIERCREAGLPEPEPLPHPDDVVINPRNGAVRILGPQTKEEKEHYDQAIRRREEAQLTVSEMKRKYEAESDHQMREMYLQEWMFEQKMFDTINEALAPRYQVDLKDRCREPGATRKGDMQKKYGFKKPF